MFVQEFLSNFDADHQNNITQEQKIRWLRRCEMQIMSDITHQHDDFDKSGFPHEVILYSRKDLPARITEDGNGFDIHDIPEMYVDDDTLVLTGYEPTMGEREADTFDLRTFLQVPEPYDVVYEYYLEMQIAHVTGNTVDYNRNATLYNEALRAFHKYWNRNHMRNHYHNHLLRHEVL